MTHLIQQGQTPAPPAAPRADDIGARIEAAINQALSEAGVANQAQGRGITIQPRGEGITIQPPFNPDNVIPPQAVDISIAFFVMFAFIIVGYPLARAFARRMDRRGETASASEIAPRLDRIEQAVEAIAIEVERVSEGQRFTTKAIAELRGLPLANPAGGWPAGAREAERVPAGETARRP